ncbi:hypothetical protein [Neisseria dumasiana]
MPEARRQALLGVQLCITCQEEADKQQVWPILKMRALLKMMHITAAL